MIGVVIGRDADGFARYGDPLTGRTPREADEHLLGLLAQARGGRPPRVSTFRLRDADGWPVEVT